jgi:transcriptional regulator with XRE-family HTH domain
MERNNRLRQLIEQSGKTVKEFAVGAGFNPMFVSQMLTGLKPVTEKTVERICEAYPDVDPTWLLYGDRFSVNATSNSIRKLLSYASDLEDRLLAIETELKALKAKIH